MRCNIRRPRINLTLYLKTNCIFIYKIRKFLREEKILEYDISCRMAKIKRDKEISKFNSQYECKYIEYIKANNYQRDALIKN